MTKHSFVKKTLITTLALSTLFAFAHAKGNWFVAGGVGVTNSKFTAANPNTNDTGLVVNNYNTKFTIKNSLNYKLSAGYEFSNFGFAIDYNLMPYAKTKENSDFSVKQEAVYVVPYLHFNAGVGRIFLKAGVGLSYAKQRVNNNYKTTKTVNYDNLYYSLTSPNVFNLPAGNYVLVEDKTLEKKVSKFNNVVRTLAWKVGAGYEYNISKAHSISVEYEYLNQKAVSQNYVFNFSYSNVKAIPYSKNPNGASGSAPTNDPADEPFDIKVMSSQSTQNIHAINLVYKYKFGA